MRVELKYSKLRMLQSDFLHKDFNKKCERNNSGLRNLFTLLTKPVKITQLAIVKGTYLIFQAWPVNLCSSTTILLPQKTFKLSSLDSRWMWYCLIFTELVLWDFPFAVAVNSPGLVNIKRKEMRTVILLQRQATQESLKFIMTLVNEEELRKFKFLSFIDLKCGAFKLWHYHYALKV